MLISAARCLWIISCHYLLTNLYNTLSGPYLSFPLSQTEVNLSIHHISLRLNTSVYYFLFLSHFLTLFSELWHLIIYEWEDKFRIESGCNCLSSLIPYRVLKKSPLPINVELEKACLWLVHFPHAIMTAVSSTC